MRNDKIFVYDDYDYTIMIFIRLFNFKSDACVSDKVHVSRAQLEPNSNKVFFPLNFCLTQSMIFTNGGNTFK